MKKAIITGVTGQDGSYLAEQLLTKGYEVHGIRRRASIQNLERLTNLNVDPHAKKKHFFLHYGDMTDSSNITKIIKEIEPDEIYHLAAQSHVKISFDIPEYTADVDGIGTLRLLQAVNSLDLKDKTKIYNAATSELYGKVQTVPQNENTPFRPQSPYGCAKLYALWICRNFRDAYDMFIASGILFNHESPRRGYNFVTKKIVGALVKGDKLYLGNTNAKRDWGYAPDYTHAMWLMLQQKKPDDFVIATGKMYSVREFVVQVCNNLDINLEWQGKGIEEKGVNTKTKEVMVEIDPYYFRPTDVEVLCGDASKARKELGWKPKVDFNELVKIMVDAELCSQN